MTSDQLQARLMAYFARHGPEQSMRSLGPLVALTGGWASNLYTLTLQRTELGDIHTTTVVLKMYAPDAQGREHANREWRALTHLRVVHYAVPHVILCEPDARHLGHPFIIMDHIPGTSPWRTFETADPVTQARLTQLFVTQLITLHALDPHLLEPAAVPPRPDSYIERELEQLRRDSANPRHAMVAGVGQWLRQRNQAVPCERPVILHRDFHPWNVLIDVAENLWVIDWDWQIGDARFDLAWTCTLMQRSNFHSFSSAVRDEYAHQSDRSLDDLVYFEVLTTVRWLLNVLPAAEVRAEFRAFLVEPVRRAQAFLQEHTGITVSIPM